MSSRRLLCILCFAHRLFMPPFFYLPSFLKRLPAKILLQKGEPIGKNPIRHIKSESYLRQAVDWHQLTRAGILQITSFPHRIAGRLSFRHNNPSMISSPAGFFPFSSLLFPLSFLSPGLSGILLLGMGNASFPRPESWSRKALRSKTARWNVFSWKSAAAGCFSIRGREKIKYRPLPDVQRFRFASRGERPPYNRAILL